MSDKVVDILIIGAGVAGMTCAIYAARAGKSVLVLESENIGGQISHSPRVENYPGFQNISGMELADKLYTQMTAFDVSVDLALVLSIEKTADGYFLVNTEYGINKARSVVIATGVTHRTLGIENEEALIGSGISYCATCDGAFFKDKDVAVVGGGNTALQNALFLSNYCKCVYLIHRRDTFRASQYMQDAVKAKSNIKYVLSSTVSAFNTQNGVLSSIVLNGDSVLPISCVFVSIGHIPHNDIFKFLVKLDNDGYIDASEDCRTSLLGVFAAGDCRHKSVRQLTTAAADGSVAAIEAVKYLDSLN